MPECEECVDFDPVCREQAIARKALQKRFMPRLYQVKLRLIEVETEIAAATSWGSVLTALDEELKNLEVELMLLTAEERTGENRA